MNKLKLFLNNKPKLKRVLKFLFLLIFIISIFFNIIVIIAVANTKTEDDNLTLKEPIVTTPIKEAYNYNGSTFIGLSEIVSYDYYERFISNLGNYEFIYNTNTKVFNFLLTGGSVNILTSNMWLVDLNSTTGEIDSTTDITTINIDLDYISPKVTEFTITFYTPNEGSIALIGNYYFNDEQHSEFLFNTFMIRNNTDVHWDRTCISFAIGDYVSLFPSGTSGSNYTHGFTNGYDSGYRVGYNDGYNVGYTSAGQGVTTNPFIVIKNAFESITSILAIELFPNFTLATLIFTPVIITLIIVIFKMFKG